MEKADLDDYEEELYVCEAESIAEYTPIDEIRDKIFAFIIDDNVEVIKEILTTNIYPELSLIEKEQHIFNMSSYSLKYNNKGEKILNYLIFDYNISEEKSLKKLIIQNEPVEKLFEIRKLNSELMIELTNNNVQTKQISKPKL